MRSTKKGIRLQKYGWNFDFFLTWVKRLSNQNEHGPFRHKYFGQIAKQGEVVPIQNFHCSLFIVYHCRIFYSRLLGIFGKSSLLEGDHIHIQFHVNDCIVYSNCTVYSNFCLCILRYLVIWVNWILLPNHKSKILNGLEDPLVDV